MSDQRSTPTRRAVLLGGATGVAGLVAGAALWQAEARPAAATAAATRDAAGAPVPVLAAVRPHPGPAAHPAPHPAPHPVSQPAWQRRWPSAICSIGDFERRCRTPHYAPTAIMLTIDDGPSPIWTPRYLRLLAKHHVRATFCMIGSQVPANRHLVREVAQQGHVIANHTWTHDEQLETRSYARMASEIERTSAAIHAAAGVSPTQFRAPGGGWGPRIFDELARRRMMPLGWDIDPVDWSRPGTAAIEHSMLAARRHDIILCHDGGGDRSQTYAALERVIPELLARGDRFVTLPDVVS